MKTPYRLIQSEKTIKIFLNEATERGYNQNLEYKKKKFKVTKEDSDSIYLNLKELDSFYKLKLESISNLDKVRDLFLVGCYTGLVTHFIKRLLQVFM